MDSRWKWMLVYLIIDFPNRIFYGIYGSLTGPSQPYLAYATNVDLATINLLWTLGNGFGMSGCFISAIIFKRYLISPASKMIFFFLCTLIMGLTSAWPPYCTSFSSLVLAFGLRYMIGGIQETAGQAFLVYTMGPISSRSLIMGFHFTVAIGFWLGPVIIKPFFPTTSNPHFCLDSENLNSTSAVTVPSVLDMEVLDFIKWPYWIVAIGHIVYSLGYLAIIYLPYKMPVHDESESSEGCHSLKKLKEIPWRSDLLVIAMIILFYMADCGSERLFQSLEFTFGLCGPLRLPPQEAVFTDQCYNGGFMIGRFLSMFVVAFIQPKHLLSGSIGLGLIASLLISIEGWRSPNYLFAGAALYGLAVSSQFGAGVSWTAEHMDVAGERTVLFHIGCSIGGALTPAIGGFLFYHVSPMSLWHFNLFCVFLQIISFTALHFIYKKREEALTMSVSEATYQKLKQTDEFDDVLDDTDEEMTVEDVIILRKTVENI